MSPMPLPPIATAETSERFLGDGLDLLGLKLHGGLPLGESAWVFETVFALLGLGILLLVLASLRPIRERAGLGALVSTLGAGGIVIGALLSLYLLNPGNVFGNFLSIDATTFWRLGEVLGLLFATLVLWSFFSLLPWRWLGDLCFVAGAALLVFTGLLIVVYTSPERLAPDERTVAAESDLTVPDVQQALDRVAREWLNRPEHRQERLEAVRALPIEERPPDLVGLDEEAALEAVAIEDEFDPQVAFVQRGESRFALYEAGGDELEVFWSRQGMPSAFPELVRTHSLLDLEDEQWWIIGGLTLIFVLGLLVFFRWPRTNVFTALGFLLGGAAFFVALGLAIDGIHPGAWQHLLGLDREAFELISEGEILWESLPATWVIALIIPLTLAYVATVYAWDRKTAGPGTKTLLITLRISVIALIIALLFEPMLEIKQSQAQDSHVIVLLDSSQSMNQVELYANRFHEVDPETNNVTQQVFIRSRYSREQFGEWVLDWLTLRDLEAQGDVTPPRTQEFRTEDARLAPIARDLRHELESLEQRRAFREALEHSLEERYRSLAVDLLQTIANTSFPNTDPQVASERRERLREYADRARDGELEPYHEIILTGKLPDGWLDEETRRIRPVLLTQGRLLYMLREVPVPTTRLFTMTMPERENGADEEEGREADGDVEEEAAEPPSWQEWLAEGRPELHESLGSREVGGMPLPVYGPMDSFVMELQVRRALRLYERAQRTVGLEEEADEFEIAEEELRAPADGIGLADLRTLIDARRAIEELTEPMRQDAAREAFGDTLAAAAELDSRIGREIRGYLPASSEARRDAESVLDHLHHTTAGGMRRLDIAIELMHPEAVHGNLLDIEDFNWLRHLQSPSRRGAAQEEDERTNTVHVYTFDERLSRQAMPRDPYEFARALDRLEAPGIKTAIGISANQAVRDLLRRHVREDQISGIVVLSDGQNNHGLPTTEQMREMEVNTVAIGSQDTLKNLELFEFTGPRQVNQGNRVSLNVRVRADRDYTYDTDENPGGETIDVRLYRIEEDGRDNERKVPIPYEVMRDQTRYEFAGGDDFDAVRNVGGSYQSLQLAPAPSTQDLIIEFDAEEGVHFNAEDIGEQTRFRLWIMPEGQEPGDTFVDEETAENNWRDLQVEFTDRKTSVLYIEGRPRYEYRYLNAMLVRDPDIRYQGFLLSADPGWPQPRSQFVDDDEEPVEALTRLPSGDTEEEKEEFFESYDVVIIGDVRHDHERISSSFWDMLETFVDRHRGSVIFIAGENYNPHGYSATDSKIRYLLPVHLYDPGAERPRPITTAPKPYVLTPEGEINEMLRLSPDREENRELWEERLHGFYWFNRYADQVKEGATVLARHPREVAVRGRTGGSSYRVIETPNGEAYPMVVFMEYGGGATLYFNTDDLWFMRGGYGDRYYRPLWNQVIHYMAARKHDDVGDEVAEVYTEKRNESRPQYNYPEPIRVEAVLRGERLISNLLTRGALELREGRSNILRTEVRNDALPESEIEEITLSDEQGDGIYRGTFFPRATGRHTIWIQELPDTVHPFEVLPPDDELQELPIDLNLLAEISHPRPDDDSERTRVHAVLAPQIAQLVLQPRRVVPLEFGNQEELSDAPLLFLIIAFLLAIEWIIRKRTRLL